MASKRKPSQRQVKVMLRFSDHVVLNLSQKHVADGTEGFGEKNRVEIESSIDEIGGNDVVIDKGVFGNPDNSIDESDNTNVSEEQISDNIAESEFVSSTDNVIETHKMNNFVNNEGTKSNKASYAKIVNNQEYVEDNKLNFKPVLISENGDEFDVFDEELVQKGSAKWELTLCGYFVGCGMSEYELNYNLRRMCSRYGLIDVKAHSNGNCFFKFRNEIGRNEVLNQGSWIVNHGPLFV
ncbi:RNA-directed DNA polymerase, eukaryota, reverse transcriptase zinc-binding domain protein [Tanacetum coccineum]